MCLRDCGFSGVAFLLAHGEMGEAGGENEGRGESGGPKEGNPWGSGDKFPEKDRLQVDESLTSVLSWPPLPLHLLPARCRPSPVLSVGAVYHWLEAELESRSTKMSSANYTRTLAVPAVVCVMTVVRSAERR